MCIAITLLNNITMYSITREGFLPSRTQHYLYPFLDRIRRSQSHEYIRLSSLRLFGQSGLFQANHHAPPLPQLQVCLKALHHENEMSLAVAIYIIWEVIEGLEELIGMTDRTERSCAVLKSLAIAVDKVVFPARTCLLEKKLRYYIWIIDHNSTRDVLSKVFSRALMDRTFESLVEIGPTVFRLLHHLLSKTGIPSPFRENSFFVNFIPQSAEPNFIASSGLPRTIDGKYACSQMNSLIDSLVNEFDQIIRRNKGGIILKYERCVWHNYKNFRNSDICDVVFFLQQ